MFSKGQRLNYRSFICNTLIFRRVEHLRGKVAHSTTYCCNRNNSNSNNEEDSIFYYNDIYDNVHCLKQSEQAGDTQ